MMEQMHSSIDMYCDHSNGVPRFTKTVLGFIRHCYKQDERFYDCKSNERGIVSVVYMK
jgi:hypothetical protein